MGRAPCCEKMGLKKGPWTPDEDQILISYIRQHGHSNWRALPKHAGLLRCGKSCRLRWINYLRPDIKRGNFSPQEEDTIINLHQLLGNRWSLIAAKLPGRTDNEIKNVWHTRLKKRLPKLDSDSTTAYHAITTTTTSWATKESTEKQGRKTKKTRKKTISKKLKLEQGNYNDQNNNNSNDTISKKLKLEQENYNDQNNDNNNNNNNNDSNNTIDTINDGERHPKLMTRDPVFHQPCTSEMSSVTSSTTSTRTSTSPCDDELIRGMENVGDKGDYFGDYIEISDDFWMEMLSLEDTAISTQDLSCEYDPNTSLDSLIEPIRFDLSSKINGDNGDVDLLWDNFFNKIQ